MEEKRRILKKHKAIATGLLLFMAVIYISCLKFFPQNTFTGYLSAFAEAAMVGALADWFAVTALFRHPLGLPIPHTNLIENSKRKIGSNLGGFITKNFLTPETIRPRLKNFSIVKPAGNWLLRTSNRKLLITEILKFIAELLGKISDEDVKKLMKNQSGKIGEVIKIHQLAGDTLEALIKEGYPHQWINTGAELLEEFVLENSNLIKEKVKEESHVLVPGFVDSILAKKIINAALKYTGEVKENPNHKLRQAIFLKLSELSVSMKEEKEWEEKFKELGNKIVNDEGIQKLTDSLREYLQQNFSRSAFDENSGLYRYLDGMIKDVAEDFLHNTSKQHEADKFLQLQFYKLVMRYRLKVTGLISQVVGDWQGRELSEKLELEVGKDLQFIRINGTVVGGIVGLAIHFLSSL